MVSHPEVLVASELIENVQYYDYDQAMTIDLEIDLSKPKV